MIHLSKEYTPHDSYDPFAALGRAIIRQAANDYRALNRKLQSRKSPNKKLQLTDELESIRKFFRSSWFATLSGVDEDKINGDLIIQKLDEEVLSKNECS